LFQFTLDEWSAHVVRLRNSHPTLNYFTTDQLVLLSSQLAKLIYANLTLSAQACMLLNLIGTDLSLQQLTEFVQMSLRRIEDVEDGKDSDKNQEDSSDSDASMSEDDDSSSSSDEDDEPVDPFKEFEALPVFTKLREDFPRYLVLASMIKCGNQNLDDLMEWCFDNSEMEQDQIDNILGEYMAQIVQPKVDEPKEITVNSTEEPIVKENSEAEEKTSIIQAKKQVEYTNLIRFKFDPNAEGLLSEKLKEIWNQFLEKVESLEITDYLSFQSLAKCLEELADFGTNPQRKVLSSFKEGSPNLVVCPEGEMHAQALSFYMLDPEKPLPTLDEILICQADTPLEQIELICRRAFSDQSGKIYIILHAEKMNYDNGMHLEQLIKKTTVSNHSYRLIFMASKERNDHSYIVTAFDKYRIQVPSVPHEDKIQSYLLSHLNSGIKADPDHSRLRIIKSKKSGNGKSLVAKRLSQLIPDCQRCILQLHDNTVDCNKIISTWLKEIEHYKIDVFHLDVTPAVHSGRADLIFSLTVLGGLSDSNGQIWLSSKQTYHIVELTSAAVVMDQEGATDKPSKETPMIAFEDYVPFILCLAPKETAELLASNPDVNTEFLPAKKHGSWTFMFDHASYLSEVFQRPFLYLSLWGQPDRQNLLNHCFYDENQPKDITSLHDCLTTLLHSCPVKTPTWMELTHFASFLNVQLKSSENSIFCNTDLMKEDFPGMKIFVVNFLIQMSKDFATRSVEISDQSQGEGFSKPKIEDRQRWENSPHPYIFFNDDGHSMSFYGFRLQNLNLIDERSGNVLVHNIMSRQLYAGLTRNKVIFNRAFDDASSAEKIADLCKVFGIRIDLGNPDKSYELTSDNVMKLLAIYMRFRSNIPVVIMGETGSGKTRLVKFLCDLIRKGKEAEKLVNQLEEIEDFLGKLNKARNDPLLQNNLANYLKQFGHAENLLHIIKAGKNFLLEVKEPEIMLQRITNVEEQLLQIKANFHIHHQPGHENIEQKEIQNLIIMKTHGGVTEENIYALVREAIDLAIKNKEQGIPLTVVFFDEANTTNAIGTIKEVMCDRLVNGTPIPNNIGLQFVAAINPYREHSDEMIKKLENAGLGYHIKADKTLDKLGKIPMRRLVYRVKEIPASMFPLVWDFGTLDADTEQKYIIQMIESQIAQHKLEKTKTEKLLKVLCHSQSFMRERKDECSFVSLRDVERMLTTLEWFNSQEKIIALKIFNKIISDHEPNLNQIFDINLILALGISYYARLDERRVEYEEEMMECLQLEPKYFSKVIIACQDIFIDELNLDQNIAKNDALKENVWMMAICIELRIPLFLVGKPGSSKSLAKTVITDVMQGDTSYSVNLFQHFKEIHMVSFQCSPLATAGGILSTFRQCQKFQEKRDLNRFAAVCVLDEVGLAEDSPKMPLKALHPLLEDGCVESEKPEPHKKVSYVIYSCCNCLTGCKEHFIFGVIVLF
jgi:hypothetical protein